jgi:serine/threonine-protein kinase
VSLSAGAKVGSYEVVGSIGAGGMGEVYRARDIRLGRLVALKVLPDTFAADPRRRARFLREAQVLASLNHSNISTLHGVEELDGRLVLVLELVEGETLGDRLARASAPLPVREVVPIARQIVDALDAAHELGIVHRDLKPDNIVMRPDGTVKVLDFGVAKVLGDFGNDAPAATITEVLPGTAPVIVGTPAYMSPEQVRGEPVTTSADVWAFGCVLYALLTGRPAFSGETRREMLGRILESDPDFSLLPPNTPPLVGRLVRRCLEKDRKARLRHIADARAYLEDAVATTTSAVYAAVRTRRRRVAGWIALAALAGALAAALTMRYTLGNGSPRVTRTVVLTEPPAVVSVTPDKSMSLTHDGSRLIYVGNGATEIFVRPLDTLTPSPLVTAPGFELRGLAVSPDDAWVSYVENSFTLRKVALNGGPPHTLVNLDAPFRGGTWDHAGGIIFATNSVEKGLQRVSADGGPVTVLTRPNREQGEATHTWPEMLPDGRGVLFTIMPTSGDLDFDAAQIAVLDLASGRTKTLMPGGRGARYLPNGHLVFVAGSELRAVAFDLRRLEIRGTPVIVVPRIVTDGIGSANVSLTADGMLAYLEPTPNARQLVWVDRQGKETALPEVTHSLRHPRISPVSDRQLAFSSFRDLFVWDLADAPVQLSFIPFANWLPLWMPDNTRLVFGSWRAGTGVSNIYMQAADGIGAVERLSDSPHMQLPSSVTPDGTAVLFTVFGPPTGPDIRLLRLTSREGASSAAPGEPALPRDEPVLDTMRHERNGVVSPDMKWLAYESDMPGAPGQMNVYVRRYPVDRNGGVWQVSSTGGTHPLWSRTGDELFYLAGDGAMMSARVSTRGDRWIPVAPTRLFKGRYVIRTSELGRQYDVTSDSRRFLMIREDSPATHRAVVIVQHWAEELKQRVR